MTLSITNGALILDPTTYATRGTVRSVLLDAMRHYAEHGTLPPEPPAWGELSVRPRHGGDGWSVWSGERLLASVVSSGATGRWMCTLHQNVPNVTHEGDTPQSAADAARAWLAERWGLRT